MKKFLPAILILILLLMSASADNLYQQDSLELQLDVNGEFDLIAEGGGSIVKGVTANLLLYPKEDFRQQVVSWESKGEVDEDRVVFTWNDGELGTHQLGYSVVIKTNNELRRVQRKVPFPLSEKEMEKHQEYLLPTTTIDSNNMDIITQASDLAEGEDDLFKVVFRLASWVEENVDYELDTVTAQASQKASWVLKNRRGVCDEMTSLFVAMCRSLGIPARFVSGISYTTSELFDENWQSHGWSEVFFPGIGWVSFDITFGEYGYVDVTHIKLRDGFDPAEPATTYEWLADKVNLQTRELQLETKVIKEGSFVPEEIYLEAEILSEEVGIGSYNLVKGILKNTADNYLATTLMLAIPDEVEVLGRNQRIILLAPKEVKETFWIVKVKEGLAENYLYTFPIIIYSEKNVSTRDEFSVQKGKTSYSKADIEKLTVKDEEKTYSRKVSFSCDYPEELPLRLKAEVKCSVKNSGNTNLYDVNFCLDKVCEVVDIPINQEKGTQISIQADKVGWNKLIVSADNELIEKRVALTYVVYDSPVIDVKVDGPHTVMLADTIRIKIALEKTSFSTPEDVVVLLEFPGIQNEWTIEKLTEKEELEMELQQLPISNSNTFSITTMWKDKEGKLFSDKQEVLVKGEARNLLERIRMFFNGIMAFFN